MTERICIEDVSLFRRCCGGILLHFGVCAHGKNVSCTWSKAFKGWIQEVASYQNQKKLLK